MTNNLTVLYDRDCGACSHTARVLLRLDSRRRLRLVPLQTADLPDMPPPEKLLASLHACDDRGRWFNGAAAGVEISRRVPVLRPLAWFAHLPFATPLLDAMYALAADNRHEISRLLGLKVCKVPERRA